MKEFTRHVTTANFATAHHRPRAKASVRGVDIMVNLAAKALGEQERTGGICFLEHPEDLGRTNTGAVPASIWQREGFRTLAKKQGTCWG